MRCQAPDVLPDAADDRGPGYYPVLLDLRGRNAVVIGGGRIAEQKVRGLLDAGAHITVVSPALSPPLAALGAAGEIAVLAREYRTGDLDRATIAIAATDDRAVNHAVWEEAEAAGVLLNAVDDVPHCHFIAPSVLRRGRIVVSVSSSGTCPALAVRLRERIATVVREEHGQLADVFGDVRSEVAHRIPDFALRTRAWYRIVDRFIDAPSLQRVLADDRTALRAVILGAAGNSDEDAEGEANWDSSRASYRGIVHLVGAGPGDPGLLTIRGLELLRSADVIVHDRLVSPELLALASSRARRIDVGKRGHGPSVPQERITAILCAEAQRGHRVVRLKGGDPFVFGRGAEEMAALVRAGVPCEVVPGVTSAIGAPAAAGISVTHRELAAAFAVVTAQRSGEGPELDWAALARIPTLVVLMGLRALGDVTARLLREGVPADRPAAVIAAATLPGQRVVFGTVGNITSLVSSAALTPPATLVVGEVVRAHSNDWQTIRSELKSTSSPSKPEAACL